ncbi:tetratricopeptide repeat protein [Candidatus Ruminimicrobiellum ovillum]|uniref:tetratricopeptide repeat protein n=1 Tax=Candidatus Ruminimicrobiellum ovillum TaxID=1947927 RepID=UPI00355A0053
MKKLMTSLLVFMFFLMAFAQVYAVIDVDASGIDPSEKEYIKIRQLLVQVRENPLREESFDYLEKAISLCNRKSSKAELYFLMSQIKQHTPLKGEYKSYAESLDLQGAKDDIDKAISLDNTQAKYYSQKASVFASVRDFYNAVKCCDEAIKLDSKNSDYIYERAQYNFYMKKYDDALKDVSAALEITKKPEYYYTKAFYEKEVGKKQEALKDIEKAIEFGDKTLNYYLYIRTRAELRLELGIKEEEAVKDLDTVIEKEKYNDNNKYWAHTIKGQFLETKEEYAKALESYKAAEKLTELKTFFQNKIKFLENKLNNKE